MPETYPISVLISDQYAHKPTQRVLPLYIFPTVLVKFWRKILYVH